jgi:hypothetical protein
LVILILQMWNLWIFTVTIFSSNCQDSHITYNCNWTPSGLSWTSCVNSIQSFYCLSTHSI